MTDVKEIPMSQEAAITPEEVKTETKEAPEEESKDTVQAGDKTDPNELLKATQEARDKKRIAEAKVAELEEELETLRSSQFPEEPEDPKVAELNKRIATIEEDRELDQIITANPELKDLRAELKEFRADEHPRAKWLSVSKLFLAEKGLIGEPKRQGLEAGTGGDRVPPKTGMTIEDAKTLRETNFNLYKEKLAAGELDSLEG